MKVFVTGVAGFLGSHIAEHFYNKGDEVSGIDSLIGGDEVNVPPGVGWFHGDILDRETLVDHLEIVKPDVVYHCAALAYEGLSVFSPAMISENIYAGSVNMQMAALRSGVGLFIQASSMARYGELSPPFNEDMAPRPCDPYGISKFAADRTLQVLAEEHGMDYCICVPHNLVGPRQRYYDPYRNVCSIFIHKMLKGEQPYIYNDGSQKRCISFIQDALSCFVKIPDTQQALGQIINVGPDEQSVTILELAQTIASLLNFKLDPIFVPGRPCEVHTALCSSNKARKLLDYKTKFTLEQGLTAMIVDIQRRGLRDFDYHLPLELLTNRCPKTWTERLM